jgi:hypothetical protein
VNWRSCGRKRLWPILRLYSNFLGGVVVRKATESFGRSRWSPGRDWNPGHPEYDALLSTASGLQCVTSEGNASNFRCERFQVLAAMSIKMTVFWDVAPWSLVEIDRRFRGAVCLHHQGDFWSYGQFIPLKTKLVYILFKNSVRTSKRTPHFAITKINWLTLFKLNPLKPKLVWILFKNSVRTSKRTPHFAITKINWLMPFKFNPLKTKLV